MKKLLKATVPVFLIFLLSSCTESGSRGGAPAIPEATQNEVIEEDGSNIQGNYAADIWPMNHNLHFKKIGAVGITREGDNFEARVNMQYGPKGARVKQALYTGRRCPNLNDDLNKDAYIDILEARLAIGKVTIPFDSDLDSQMAGHGSYPTVGIDGKMSWAQSASFSRLFADLKETDEDTSDELIKLKDNEGITLPGRIVLFQGVPESLTLPETVATTDGETAKDSLPSGCAVLWKVDELPAELKDPVTAEN